MSEDEKNETEKKSALKKPHKKPEAKRNLIEKEKLMENLPAKLKEASDGLLYTSETDAPFEPFVWQREDKPPIDFTSSNVLKFAGSQPDVKIEEKTLDDFFARLTEIQDWYEDEEKAGVEKFVKLKEMLAANLKNIKVFRVGTVQIDIYIAGIDADGNLAGLKTKAVET